MQPGEKPEVVKTHLRNMIIMPEMIGSVLGVYNGKVFNTVEIKVRDTHEFWRPYNTAPPLLHCRAWTREHEYRRRIV